MYLLKQKNCCEIYLYLEDKNILRPTCKIDKIHHLTSSSFDFSIEISRLRSDYVIFQPNDIQGCLLISILPWNVDKVTA